MLADSVNTITPQSPVTTEAAPIAAPISTSEPTAAIVSAVTSSAPIAQEAATSEVIASDVTTNANVAEEKPNLLLKKPESDVAPVVEAAPELPKEEASQSEIAPLPTYELTIPDDVKLDDTGKLEFTNLLGEYEARVMQDPAQLREATQELAQELINRYVAEQKNLVKALEESQKTAKLEKLKEWETSFRSDPEIGGNRADTTLESAMQYIKTYGGNEAQQDEFFSLLEETGLSNHPAMIRMLANGMLARPAPQPLPAQKPMPQIQSKIQKRYGGSR
jgi:hypothetical protein